MSSPLDDRIRSFVVELLDDPPPAPPFPHQDTVVISDRRTGRERMTDTKISSASTERSRRLRGPIAAVAAFAAVLVVALAAVVVPDLLGDDPDLLGSPEGPTELAGTDWTGADIPGDDLLRFGTDGRYVVFGVTGAINESGTYEQDGFDVTFKSDSRQGCDGVPGRYRFSFSEPGRAVLEVVSDDCAGRRDIADGWAVVQVLD
jgi:hypothetical protein